MKGKTMKKLFAYILAVTILLGTLSGKMITLTMAKNESKHVDMLVTHDIHSHLDSFEVLNDKGEKETVGGFARMKTLIDIKKAENPDTLLLDAGDFSMGTLYQTLFESDATELVMLGKLGFEATTFGNHEFDYGSKALANMFDAAMDSGVQLPKFLVCNVDLTKETGDSKLISDAYKKYGGQDYAVFNKGNVKIAVLGVFGIDALDCAPTCELTFKDPVESVKKTVAQIKANEQVDMIVCISHSGTWEDESKSEDEILAKEVPDLDVIVSGHTHTYLEKPIVHGDTHIVSVGEYGQRIGSISMTQKENGRWNLDSYQGIRLDDTYEENKEIQNDLKNYGSQIGKKYLNQFGYEKDQVLFKNNITFESSSETSVRHDEIRLGNFMSDAYVYSVENLSDDKTPVAVAVVPSGVIRESIYEGDVTVADIFETFSLGNGPDGIVGYPLVSVYLTGAELKIVAEIDASVSDFMTAARLYMSGLNFSYNPNRLILNKVTDAYLTDSEGKRQKIEDKKLYRVVADLYSGRMLSSVTDISKGILSIKPKDKDGNVITDFEEHLVYMNGKEMKAWYAIAAYANSFEEEDGVKVTPGYYETTHDRKVVDDSKNIVDLIKNPNKYAVAIVGIVVVVLIVFVLLLRKIFKIIRRKTGKEKNSI